MSEEWSAEAIEPGKAPPSARITADPMTESSHCMELDHPYPQRIDAEQFDQLDDFLLDLRTEVKVEPDGFEAGLFVEVISTNKSTSINIVVHDFKT
jgi:hypothetical protein